MAKKSTTKKSPQKPAQKPNNSPESPSSKITKSVSSQTNARKSNKSFFTALISIVALVMVGVIIVVILNNKSSELDPKASLSYSDAFFIYNNSEYTLWNADGKQLTEDKYTDHSNFIAGYAYVKKDDQFGIINQSGKMTVDFGKYSNILARGGLYLVQENNTNTYQLLTGNGKVIQEGEDLTITTDDQYTPFAVVSSKDQINLYTYSGKQITSVSAKDSDQTPKIDSTKDFGIFHYDKKTIVFDARTNDILTSFEDDLYYEFDSVSDDRSKILLKYHQDDKYKLIVDHKVFDLNETKYYTITPLNNIIGYDDYSKVALLNDDYKILTRVSDYLELKDSYNYAVENDHKTVEIYHNGEKVQTMEKAKIPSSGVLYENFYAIEKDNRASFYHLDGTPALGRDFKHIYSLFDKYHHAIVADEENEYYLIDNNGNRISNFTASKIFSRDGGYELRDQNDKYALASSDGEQITEYNYKNLYYRINVVDHSIWTAKIDDDNSDVIDADNKKIILENVNVSDVQPNYIKVKTKDNKSAYYTLKGELFYTTEE